MTKSQSEWGSAGDEEDAEALLLPTPTPTPPTPPPPPGRRGSAAPSRPGGRSWPRAVLASLAAAALPALLPAAHLLLLRRFFADGGHVDRDTCSCSCWDGVYKGDSESEPFAKSREGGSSTYKHVYFNATSQAFRMWAATVVWVLVFYEAVRYVLSLHLEDRLRRPMGFVLAAAVFPQYHFWWGVWNAWNDGVYEQWSRLLVFGLAGTLSTLVALSLADHRRPVTVFKMLLLVEVSMLHLTSGVYDNFFTDLMQGTGYIHKVLRGLGLGLSDLLNLGVGLWNLRQPLQRCDAFLWRTTFLMSSVLSVTYLAVALM